MLRLGCLPFCTPGDKPSSLIPISTALCPAAVCPLITAAGYPHAPTFPACQSPQSRFPRQVRSWIAARFSQPPTRVLWRVPATCKREELRCLSTHAVSAGLGRLCQTALWWTRTRPSLPGPLHPSRCHLQPPTALGLRLRGRLPLEGLRAWQQAPYHDSLSGGVPAPFPTACFTQRLSPYPLLRLAGQPRTQEPAPTLSSSTQPATARNRSIVFKPTCHLAVPTLPWPDVRHRTTHRCPDPFAGMQTRRCL